MPIIEVCIRTKRWLIKMISFRRGIPAQPILDGLCGNYEVGMPRSMVNYPAFNYDIPIWDNVTTTTSVTTQETTTIALS